MPIADTAFRRGTILKSVKIVLVPLVVVLGTVAMGIMSYFSGKAMLATMTADQMQTVAMLAGNQFDIDAVSAIQPQLKPATPYHALVVQLKGIRKLLPQAGNVFIVQRMGESWQYVAGTNSFDGDMDLDTNKNGQVDPSEKAVVAGAPFDRSGFQDSLAILTKDPTLNVTLSETGGIITSYTALRTAKGDMRGILGIDAHIYAKTLLLSRVIFTGGCLLLFGVLLSQCLGLVLRKRNLGFEKQMDAERLALMELATHQLGAPLATFRWWMELMRDPDTSETVERSAIVEQVSDAVNRLDGIIKALSNATKVGLGEVKFEEQVLGSLKYIILRAVQEATPRLKTQCLKVKVLYDDKVGPVKVDSKQFLEVMKELLDNAISFTPSNKSIVIQVTKKKNMCQVDVTDEGYGIPENDMNRVTEKFFRASNAAKYKPVGNGMGLFNVKGIIDRHGGKMALVSREGKGTTVSFTLQLAPKQDEDGDEAPGAGR